MHSLLIDIALDYFKSSTRVATFPYIDGAGRFLYWLRVFQVLGEWGRISKPCAVVLLNEQMVKTSTVEMFQFLPYETFFKKIRGFLALGSAGIEYI